MILQTTMTRTKLGRNHLSNLRLPSRPPRTRFFRAANLVSRSLRAFSLVELLVVIAVLSILMVLVLPSISSLGGAGKLASAGNLAVDTIKHARQVARSKNTLTMIAMINSGTDNGRAYATLAFSATNGTNGTWSQFGRWQNLPDGIWIEPTKSVGFFQTPPLNAPTLNRAGASVARTGYKAAVFLPDGRLNVTSTNMPVVHLQRTVTGASTNNYYKIIINEATGVPIIRRP